VLEGCSSGWDTAELVRALEIEASSVHGGEGRRLSAVFECPLGLGAELRVDNDAGVQLARARVRLDEIPNTARVRMLALVWTELLRASFVEPDAPLSEMSAPPAVTAKLSHDSKVEEIESDVKPVAARSEGVSPSAPQLERAVQRRWAQRSALFTRAPAGARAFDVSGGGTLRHFFATPTTLLGFDAGVRLGPASVNGLFATGRVRTSLGIVQTRLAGGSLDAALACAAWSVVQTCGLVEASLAQAKLTGAASGDAESSSLSALFSSAALAASARLSASLLALELLVRGGFARGPSASVDGFVVSAPRGGFLSLTIAGVVQP